MAGWLRGLLGGGNQPTAAKRTAATAASPAAPAPAQPLGKGTGQSATSSAAGLLPLSKWSGLQLRKEKDLAQGEHDQVISLARAVRDHFQLHRPGPSTFPALAMRVIDLVEQPDVDIARLVNVISQDSAIVANIIKAANSVENRRSTKIEDLRTCINLLGLKEVAHISVAVAGRSLFDMETRAEFELCAAQWNRLYLMGMTSAFTAGWLAQKGSGRADHAFLGGMFVDIGKSIALRSYSKLLIEGKLTTRASENVIGLVLEQVHLELGVAMHATWRLPQFSAVICKRHHEPKIEPQPREDLADLHIVRIVSGLNQLRWGYREPLAAQVSQSITALRLPESRIRALGEELLEFEARSAKMFEIQLDADRPGALG